MVANRLRDAAAVLEVDSAYRRDAAIMREAADEVERLRHDIARHVAIACELATECERLRAENADLRNANQILRDARRACGVQSRDRANQIWPVRARGSDGDRELQNKYER